MIRTFGWCSRLMVNRHYTKHLNGACYEISLVKWKEKAPRNIEKLIEEITRANYTFASEADMVVLLEEMDLPPSFSIYSKLPDGRVAAIDAFHLRKDHIRRTTDCVPMGDYDLYAIVHQELVDNPERTRRLNTPKSIVTVA